jgi:Zn-dependent protease with chaperone function
MTIPYFARLLGLSLATFFLVHTLLALTISFATPAAIRFAGRITPVWAARFLFSLRLLPSVFGACIVLGLCVPSYLRLEPAGEVETAGFACIAAAILSVAIAVPSAARALRLWFRSARYVRSCRSIGSPTHLAGEPTPVLIITASRPFLALSGVFKLRLLISRGVLAALSPDELAMALRHERAHRTSHDNLKRLLILLSPGILPFVSGFGALERAWARFAEWAADDRAVDGDDNRSVSLAAALVRVARLGAASQPGLLATSLIGDDPNLSARVDRLLNPAPPRVKTNPWTPIAIGSAALVLTVSLFAFLPLSSVHGLLEHLMD